jgi:dTDP-glucose pyrophosphorylase
MAWPKPLSLADDFVGSGDSGLVLGDNIFYGHEFAHDLKLARPASERCHRLRLSMCIDPERYGVVEFDAARPGDQPGGKAQRSPNPATR